MLKNKCIFITGGAGFIASHFVDVLSPENRLILYDVFYRNSLQYIDDQKKNEIDIIRGDVLNLKTLTEAMAGCDIVIHCAAVAGIYSVIRNATMTMKVNFLGTYHALEAAVKNRVKHFINFSTSEVYGPHVYDGKEEDTTTQGPMSEKRWIYAVSKLAAEHFSHTYELEYGLNVTTVRPFNIYGPRQVGEGAIRQMIIKALRNEELIVYNDGTQIRSWCYVKDFVNAVLPILERKEAWGEVFNIGNPEETISVLNLARTIVRLMGSSSTIKFKKHPGPDVSVRVPNIEKARKILGYKPRVNLEEGIKQTIKFYQQHPEINFM